MVIVESIFLIYLFLRASLSFALHDKMSTLLPAKDKFLFDGWYTNTAPCSHNNVIWLELKSRAR